MYYKMLIGWTNQRVKETYATHNAFDFKNGTSKIYLLTFGGMKSVTICMNSFLGIVVTVLYFPTCFMRQHLFLCFSHTVVFCFFLFDRFLFSSTVDCHKQFF